MNQQRKISLSMNNIDKYYGSYHALNNINIDVEEGEFLVLVGPSGCGKSTLMRCIAGLEKVDSGKLEISGRDVTHAIPSERGVAMVFQSYALYPHMTVAENIGFPLKIAKKSKAEIQEGVAEAARILKIENLLQRRPRELSGGQRQRVAIGRAIVHHPEIYLFDEPLSNLDAALRVEMRVELARLHNATGNTMVYVTHDQVEAMTMASRIVVLNGGVIEQIGSPLELFNNPANKFVAGFIGQPTTNFVTAKVVGRSSNSLELQIGDGRSFGTGIDGAAADNLQELEIGIRPNCFTVCAADDADIHMNVDVVEHLGDETLIYGTTNDGQSMTVQVGGQIAVHHGEKVNLKIDAERVMVFNPEGINISPRHAVHETSL
ncbi:ABC transporter ATP-binding protein [uncultured Nitratireductor sp.]|uniref:ABC transporter ATP-binding protein n=1 Tax=uncultured Nitratireductor sp. TaxID=520953 RepID=UPI0026072A20|nr:ABC transporter ATP-binding protein [uncultured Nitratireductor sp.]